MSRSLKFFSFAILTCSVATGGARASGWQHIGNVQRVEKLPDGMELSAGSARVRITAFRDGVIRVRLAPQGAFAKDFSWAVVETANAPAVKIEDGKSEVRMTAGGVVVVVKKSPLLVSFADLSGNVILADEPSLPMAWDGAQIHVWKHMPPEEGYYGLGDKPGPLNHRDRAYTMWNTDFFGWQESDDPLYKAIPFFIGLNKGTAYGVFFDNTHRSSFDFGKESRDYLSFGAEGGELNYYFIAGPQPKKVVEEFTALVGRTPLPPLWTMGYQQSRYSYYPEARAREIVQTLREKKIPADAIYLDIDYQEGYAPFTINREYFPHFEQMIGDFRKQGMRTVLITDLHIKKDPGHGYAPYDSGMKEDVFVKNADGSVYVGKVWPGDSVFPDFTLTRVRDWWGGLYKNFVDMGVAGFWNDMNEPSVFFTPTKTFPLDVRHHLDDGTWLDHRAIHNVFGMQNVRATHDGLLKLRPDERPFVLTRAAYAGTERYAATWTGDNSATWNHIGMSVPQIMNLGLSGYALVGADVGGFAGSPPADLLTRWYELGAFYPIYRDHAAKGTADHEPWASGPEQEGIRERYIELRYRLLPYIYTAMEETSRTGVPLMEPIFLEYPEAQDLYGQDHTFLFGRDLFVAPVVSERLDAEEFRLPPGDWFDFWTGAKHSSNEQISLHPALDETPLYVRAGAIVPMQPVVQSTNDKPDGPLELRVYPGGDCRGSLYQDDGISFAYQKGDFLRVKFSCQVSSSALTITSSLEKNAFQPWWNSTELEIQGMAVEPKEVRVGDQQFHDWRYDRQTHVVSLTVPDALRNWIVRVDF
ncbi:MAG TPA: glycoside hydrolase family 31 protein [Candidatus Methylomirabilis sp.]|nr:glycoside hydrolase family 31 protein [Candidatus Methylomirabilis sp.]